MESDLKLFKHIFTKPDGIKYVELEVAKELLLKAKSELLKDLIENHSVFAVHNGVRKEVVEVIIIKKQLNSADEKQ